MKKTCLLVTERFEPTADLLIAELRRRGVPCLRWNLDQFPLGSSLTFRASNADFGAEVISDGRRVDLESIGSVWCRGFQPTGFPIDIGSADKKFAETEARRVLAGLMSVVKPVWVNHPHSHALANSKPAQLFIARQVGLEIPPTIISNDPTEVGSFISKSKEQTVYKTLSQSLELERGKALFTSAISERELAKLNLIRLTPGIFQRLIPKAFELRVTVVGPHIFPAKIDSQANVETKIDWRHAPFEVDGQPIDLPSDVRTKIQAFMAAFGLIYGAFDFIVTPEGHHVFLELNPSGQYMWIEARTGHQITGALSDALCQPCQ